MFYRFAHRLVKCIFWLMYRLKVVGLEKVPKGAGVISGNHTSNLDSIIIGLSLPPDDGPRFMAKKELFKFKPFGWLISALGAYPVDRGKADIKAIKTSLGILRSGHKLLVFPEGRRVAESEAADVKNGAAMLASRTNSPIVPVYISRGRKPFINKITVVFGEPFKFEKDKKAVSPKDYPAIIDDVMREVGRLGGA